MQTCAVSISYLYPIAIVHPISVNPFRLLVTKLLLFNRNMVCAVVYNLSASVLSLAAFIRSVIPSDPTVKRHLLQRLSS